MISDTLFEAIEEIERYQRDMPEMYDDLRDLIEPVKEAMRSLRIYLDTPPNPGALEAARRRCEDANALSPFGIDAR